MSESDDLKRAAAVRAAEWIQDGMVLGLGTGSTAAFVLEEIAAHRSRGQWKAVIGIPTSERTADLAHHLGIPLSTLDERPDVDLTIDGADEVDRDLRLIKGAGGALLREKIVATASETVIIVVDESKRVERLGTRASLPVEVDPFGATAEAAFLRALGCEPSFRLESDGSRTRTDGGHFLIDCRFAHGIEDAVALERRLNYRAGVVENGLFIDLADYVVFASPSGVEVTARGDALP